MQPSATLCKEVLKNLEQCKSAIENLRIDRCFDRFQEFCKNIISFRSGLGFSLSNEDYLEQQPKDLMELPHAFRYGFDEKAKAVAAQQNWKFVQFYRRDETRTAENRRSIAHFEGERSDQWILFSSIQDPPTEAASMIVIEKKDPSGQTLSTPRIHFREHTRKSNDSQPFKIDAKSDGQCTSCHINGLREIILTDQESPNDRSTADELNKRIRSYGALDWHKSFDIQAFGPPLGTTRVRCHECHNGRERSPINLASSEEMLFHKIYAEKSMPKTSRPTERSIAASEFPEVWENYRRKTFQSWLFDRKNCEKQISTHDSDGGHSRH